jgi:hypothetical protein
MLVDATAQERSLLWLAAVGRLVSPRTAASYLPLAKLTTAERAALLDTFCDQARTVKRIDIPGLLEADWEVIWSWTNQFYRSSAVLPTAPSRWSCRAHTSFQSSCLPCWVRRASRKFVTMLRRA